MKSSLSTYEIPRHFVSNCPIELTLALGGYTRSASYAICGWRSRQPSSLIPVRCCPISFEISQFCFFVRGSSGRAIRTRGEWLSFPMEQRAAGPKHAQLTA
jgi:hypothetical protein